MVEASAVLSYRLGDTTGSNGIGPIQEFLDLMDWHSGRHGLNYRVLSFSRGIGAC
jgi:hypothetical protein